MVRLSLARKNKLVWHRTSLTSGSNRFICYRVDGRSSTIPGSFNNAIMSRRSATYLYLLCFDLHMDHLIFFGQPQCATNCGLQIIRLLVFRCIREANQVSCCVIRLSPPNGPNSVCTSLKGLRLLPEDLQMFFD